MSIETHLGGGAGTRRRLQGAFSLLGIWLLAAGCGVDGANEMSPSYGGGKGDAPGARPQGTYEGPGGALFSVHSILARVELPDGNEYSGDLHSQDGSGAEFIIGQLYDADYVCGTYSVAVSGFAGADSTGSHVKLIWLRPDAPVPPACSFMADGEGVFTRTGYGQPTCERQHYVNADAGAGAGAAGFSRLQIVQVDDRPDRIDLLTPHEQIAISFVNGANSYYAWSYINDQEPPMTLARRPLSEEHRGRILTLARQAMATSDAFELELSVTGVLLGYFSLGCASP